MICVGSQYGLQWHNGMQDIVDESIAASTPDGRPEEAEITKVETSTGLYPFLLAASATMHNLDTIYELTRRSLHIIVTSIRKTET